MLIHWQACAYCCLQCMAATLTCDRALHCHRGHFHCMQKPRIGPYHIQPGFASIRVSYIREKGNCRNRLILGSYTMPNAPIEVPVCFDMTSRKPPDLLVKLVPYAVRIVPLKMIIRGSYRHLSAAQVWAQQDVTQCRMSPHMPGRL